MSIHQLPRVVGVIARLLEPHRQIAVVESFLDELWVTTYRRLWISLIREVLYRNYLPKGGWMSVTLVL